MKQQTAVEWLREKIKETYNKEGKLPLAYTLDLVRQAKTMEWKQLVDAHGEDRSYLQDDGSWKRINGEQYYNETYNK